MQPGVWHWSRQLAPPLALAVARLKASSLTSEREWEEAKSELGHEEAAASGAPTGATEGASSQPLPSLSKAERSRGSRRASESPSSAETTWRAPAAVSKSASLR